MRHFSTHFPPKSKIENLLNLLSLSLSLSLAGTRCATRPPNTSRQTRAASSCWPWTRAMAADMIATWMAHCSAAMALLSMRTGESRCLPSLLFYSLPPWLAIKFTALGRQNIRCAIRKLRAFCWKLSTFACLPASSISDNLLCTPFSPSLPLLVSSCRCSPPSQKQDYQKIYSHWCNEFEKYKSAMKQWQAKQEVSGASRQEGGASIKFEFNNSWRSRVFGVRWQLWQQLPLIVLMNFPCKSPNFHVIFPWHS